MRLSKIKLAGFKSFVDPTTIRFPSNLIGIVGPNGCGKSNVIDAVRWVMGESSAKHLRGDSMADVIFNGSSARKPVGTAFIELIFDNSDGKVGGQYAGFTEISIKRQVSRDGTSTYFLNGTRCRRRDITDIFLGTGLGPRSYAIIEQGMISRLIEAKPEELRIFLEEAAGISKYKERRRETENRIKHTRENISRLDDLRGEIEKQIQHLQRQAKTAERYKGMKEEERRLRAELIALRWKSMDEQVNRHDRSIAEKQNLVDASVAEQRAIEKRIEKNREEHTEANDVFNEVQGRFYSAGADVARVEQSIQHAREMRGKQEKDLKDAEQDYEDIQGLMQRDSEQLREIDTALEEMEPKLKQLREVEQLSAELLAAAEERMAAWQSNWDEFNQSASDAQQSVEVERTRIDGLEQRVAQITGRIEKLKDERSALSSDELEEEIQKLGKEGSASTEERDRLQRRLSEVKNELDGLRGEDQSLTQKLQDQRDQLANLKGRLASLEALQQDALGKSKAAVNQWLSAHKLENLPRLAEKLDVENGWERAIETVLGFHLEAVCVEQLDNFTAELEKLVSGSLTLFDQSTGAQQGKIEADSLASKIKSDLPIKDMVTGIFAVDGLVDAIKRRNSLKPGQSLITRDGIWLGPNWVRVNREEDERAGVLGREQEIKRIETELKSGQEQVSSLGENQVEIRARIKALEARRDEVQGKVNQAHKDSADLGAKLDSQRSRLDQMVARAREIDNEIEELREELANSETGIKSARSRLDSAQENHTTLEKRREQLQNEREDIKEGLDEVRRKAREDREAVHELALKVESRRSAKESTRSTLKRLEGQLAQLETRRAELRKGLSGGDEPLDDFQKELQGLLQKRQQVEDELTAARNRVEEVEQALREVEQERVVTENKLQQQRSELEQLKLDSQEVRVRKQTLNENLKEMEFEAEMLFDEMPEEASVEVWDQKLRELEQRIDRLGAINLAAIQEFSEQSERKQYLDAQHADLIEALTTLENAIKKIDRETRTRFKETFDKVDAGFKEAFPRLFGGGHAYLELTGEDLLDAGVTVMARPPGKRNSTIHLLSGGEKALTAVALVFAIFQLNPAPFCMLDEVDAPLDDANVGRFCDLVKEMSEQVQFVFITHNKITMEMARQLTGVTMNEPGVSRLVAVDIDEAVQMAAM